MKKKLKQTNRLVIGVVLGLLVVSSAVVFASNSSAFSAVTRPQVIVSLTGTVERNEEMVALDKASEVKPGEVLRWTISSNNQGDGNASDYKAVGRIPEGTEFVLDSAKADGEALVTFTIDGGKTFSPVPMIEEKQLDGTVKMVPAPASMYSQVRFEWKSALVAKETINARYDVKVK